MQHVRLGFRVTYGGVSGRIFLVEKLQFDVFILTDFFVSASIC